jgi:omega-6 fatty acid desaturase (delta-12 desaturase)
VQTGSNDAIRRATRVYTKLGLAVWLYTTASSWVCSLPWFGAAARDASSISLGEPIREPRRFRATRFSADGQGLSPMSIDESTLTPSNSYGIWSVAKNLVPLFALYALAPVVADRSIVLAWTSTPFAGLLIYRLTMAMHDCGHLTLFSTRGVNVAVGRLLGFVSGVDFDRFRDRHREHHRNHGRPGDPQGFHYVGISNMSRPAFLWHLLKPLFGLNLKYVYAESLLSPLNLRRALRSAEMAGFIATQGVVFVLITAAGRHPSLILLPMVGAMTFGLFFSQLRGMAEHGIRAADAHAARLVRSHRADWLGSLLLFDVHFNYHAEHHEHPGVPSCRLPGLSTVTGGARTSRASMWHTLRRMLYGP